MRLRPSKLAPLAILLLGFPIPMHRDWGPLAGLVAAPGTARAAEPVRVTRKAVDERVEKMATYLWSQANEQGHWDDVNPPKRGGPIDKRNPDSNYGGETALMLLALKVAGADEQEARFQKALMERPRLFGELLNRLETAPKGALLRVVREVRDGNW